MCADLEQRRDHGILEQITATANAFLGFFQVRAQLLALEAREGIHSLKLHATLLSLGIVFILLGYVGGMAAAVSLLSRQISVSWETIVLWLALPHLIGGVGLVWFARERLFQPLFDSTLEELEKDQGWLRKNVTSSGGRRS